MEKYSEATEINKISKLIQFFISLVLALDTVRSGTLSWCIMPLFINDSKIEAVSKIDSFVKDFPHFKETSDLLLKQEIRTVGPQQLLYIGQREVAGTSPQDEFISILGSEDATTCHIAVLRHTGSGATAMIHFDGCSIEEGLESMVSIVTDLTEDVSSGRLEIHVVGGFLDEQFNSHSVSDKLLKALCKSKHDIHLKTACITHFNTVYKNKTPFPVIYGIAVDVKTGELYRATFPDKGPDLAVRGARHFTGGKENLKIYDPKSQELRIGPFEYRKMPSVDVYLTFSDQQIRQNLSTSPAQEPEGFENNVRASLVQLRDHPNPLKTVFKRRRPKRYRKDPNTGEWTLISS